MTPKESISEWVPEIRDLPDHLIQMLWEAPENLLRQAGITLGQDSPWPIVDHQNSRQEALSLFRALGEKGQNSRNQ